MTPNGNSNEWQDVRVAFMLANAQRAMAVEVAARNATFALHAGTKDLVELLLALRETGPTSVVAMSRKLGREQETVRQALKTAADKTPYVDKVDVAKFRLSSDGHAVTEELRWAARRQEAEIQRVRRGLGRRLGTPAPEPS